MLQAMDEADTICCSSQDSCSTVACSPAAVTERCIAGDDSGDTVPADHHPSSHGLLRQPHTYVFSPLTASAEYALRPPSDGAFSIGPLDLAVQLRWVLEVPYAGPSVSRSRSTRAVIATTPLWYICSIPLEECASSVSACIPVGRALLRHCVEETGTFMLPPPLSANGGATCSSPPLPPPSSPPTCTAEAVMDSLARELAREQARLTLHFRPPRSSSVSAMNSSDSLGNTAPSTALHGAPSLLRCTSYDVVSYASNTTVRGVPLHPSHRYHFPCTLAPPQQPGSSSFGATTEPSSSATAHTATTTTTTTTVLAPYSGTSAVPSNDWKRFQYSASGVAEIECGRHCVLQVGLHGSLEEASHSEKAAPEASKPLQPIPVQRGVLAESVVEKVDVGVNTDLQLFTESADAFGDGSAQDVLKRLKDATAVLKRGRAEEMEGTLTDPALDAVVQDVEEASGTAQMRAPLKRRRVTSSTAKRATANANVTAPTSRGTTTTTRSRTSTKQAAAPATASSKKKKDDGAAGSVRWPLATPREQRPSRASTSTVTARASASARKPNAKVSTHSSAPTRASKATIDDVVVSSSTTSSSSSSSTTARASSCTPSSTLEAAAIVRDHTVVFTTGVYLSDAEEALCKQMGLRINPPFSEASRTAVLVMERPLSRSVKLLTVLPHAQHVVHAKWLAEVLRRRDASVDPASFPFSERRLPGSIEVVNDFYLTNTLAVPPSQRCQLFAGHVFWVHPSAQPQQPPLNDLKTVLTASGGSLTTQITQATVIVLASDRPNPSTWKQLLSDLDLLVETAVVVEQVEDSPEKTTANVTERGLRVRREPDALLVIPDDAFRCVLQQRRLDFSTVRLPKTYLPRTSRVSRGRKTAPVETAAAAAADTERTATPTRQTTEV